MAVRASTIEEDAEKQVVVMAGYHRLNDVIEIFLEKKYAENEAYLVVCEQDGRVGVMSFLELHHFIAQVGQNLAEIPLAQWQIPEASRVWVNEEVESGSEVVEWVERHPGSRGVVVDKQGQFFCLFTNPNLSALQEPFLILHGPFAILHNDPRRKGPRVVEKLTCPHCQHQDDYTITDQSLICKNQACQKEIG